jgi:hypothetical protein
MRILLATLLFAVTAHAQHPPRSFPRTIIVESEGDAPLARAAWQFDTSATSTIQVRTRTARGERAVKDVAFRQETIVRLYTLRGSFKNDTPITTATWRILDAGARLDDPTDEQLPPDGPQKHVGRGTDGVAVDATASPNVAQTFEARLASLSDKTLKRLNGASLRQKVTPTGLIASATIPVLEDLTVRTYAEVMNLGVLLGFGEVALPDQRIGIGARWSTTMRGELGGAPVRIKTTWTLKAREGDRLKLGMTYETRVAEETNDSRGKARVARLARNGHGEVNIDLAQPLSLGVRLIQLPLPGNAIAPDVTWITIDSIGGTPALGPAR